MRYKNTDRSPRGGDIVITPLGNRTTIIRFVTRPGQHLDDAFARVQAADGRQAVYNTRDLELAEDGLN